MKRLSIRAKITLWFALAMSVLAALTLGCVWMISDNVVQKNIKDSLVEMVSDNVDEVEYYRNKEDANPDGDRDIYIQYKNGYLEIDDDYLDQMNGIYTTLYKEDYELLYGENPIAEAREIMPLLCPNDLSARANCLTPLFINSTYKLVLTRAMFFFSSRDASLPEKESPHNKFTA